MKSMMSYLSLSLSLSLSEKPVTVGKGGREKMGVLGTA